MLITRYTKIVMVTGLAVFCLLVAFNNLTDYGTNYLFVKRVMSMETTFAENALMYRSVTSPIMWRLFYALIIAAEIVTGVLFLAGAVRLWQLRAEPGAVFDRGKTLVVAGALVAFLLWFVGFMLVAGEWFVMWQSQTWNGQEPAFWFYMTVLAVLIFVSQPDADLASPEPAPAKKSATKRKSGRTPSRRRTDRGRRRSDTQ